MSLFGYTTGLGQETGADLSNQQIEALSDNSMCPFDLCPKG